MRCLIAIHAISNYTYTSKAGTKSIAASERAMHFKQPVTRLSIPAFASRGSG